MAQGGIARTPHSGSVDSYPGITARFILGRRGRKRSRRQPDKHSCLRHPYYLSFHCSFETGLQLGNRHLEEQGAFPDLLFPRPQRILVGAAVRFLETLDQGFRMRAGCLGYFD